MQYDPIKRSLGNVFNQSVFLRKLFYYLLDLLLLRCWHIHKELRSFSKTAGRDLQIFDAGAGFGQYSFWMYKFFKNCNILAVDVKDEQVADCNQFFNKIGASKNVKFIVGDLTQYQNPNAFNLILCVDVMEHIEDDNACFRNYYTSLKPNGMLLISTPSDQGGSDVHDGADASFIEEHVRDGYNINDIQEKLKLAGFNKIDARYNYGTPGKISWRLSMKYPIQVLGISKLFFILIPFYYLLVYPCCFVLNYMDTYSQHPTGTGLVVKAWK
jgi:SAM-dependent methyltransferase